ncbi:hypothetical protein [Peredibacter starrii]|uniref:Uncharacterized protein n=1 Tax=Peredibacter starrii TaxID=28202 RepID=A0AAX4HM38_9BACT|nr:hypothetical protein [Peredibacter starrii]WPU64232.1 hypothetical protein SOO65_16180 [Peredibacter starrii]
MKYLLLLLIPAHVFAASFFDLTEEELNPSSEEVLIKKPEKYQRDESMIYNFNSSLGIKDQRRYTGEDRNRFSLAGHISGDYEHFNNLLGAEVAYMRRSTRYNQFWYGAQFFAHNTYFDAITQNHNLGTNPNSEAQFQRPGDSKAKVMAGGLGIGYRFKLLLEFLPTEDWFENIDVFVNYVQMDDSFIDRKYAGYGLTTNYGLHKRAGTSFFYGGKLSYNIASVTREAIGDESKSDRTFALGWLSLGVEMGFFY